MIEVNEVKKFIKDKSDDAINIAKNIWEYAELSYEEYKSSKELITALEKEGFTIESGIADMPTAFKATYGKGGIRVGLLAEYDALDGLSQEAGVIEKKTIESKNSGHGCGHNLIAGGCYLTAVALKEYIKEKNLDLTIVFFGCPAEEGAGSKQFIARAGYFDDIDFALAWHPAYLNEVPSKGSVAIIGANFIFDGIASHAGQSPHLGRSALDACELMNVGCNYLREHMIDKARVHYAYSDVGGSAPNVVQDHAVIKYEVRAPKTHQAKDLFSRVVNIANGAALMTETKMKYEITMAFSDYFPNITLAKVMDKSLSLFGAPEWSDSDYEFAKEFFYSYEKTMQHEIKENLLDVFGDKENVEKALEKPLDSVVHPYNPNEREYNTGSTDVGDVGYATPTIVLHIASQVLGNIGHTWQTTSISNSDVSMKALVRAAEVMMHTILSVVETPSVIEEAKKELYMKNDGKYSCPLPNHAKPPIGKY